MKKLQYTTSKGIIKDIPEYGSWEWRLYQYEMAKVANRGHNYQYWNEEKHSKMLENGWQLYKFEKNLSRTIGETYATLSENSAQEIVKQLRTENNYARIIAGYSQNVQRMKMFSIIYKKKK